MLAFGERNKRSVRGTDLLLLCTSVLKIFFYYIKKSPSKEGKQERREGKRNGRVLVLDFYQESTLKLFKML